MITEYNEDLDVDLALDAEIDAEIEAEMQAIRDGEQVIPWDGTDIEPFPGYRDGMVF